VAKELLEMFNLSKVVQALNSVGSIEILLVEMFRSVMRLKVLASLGGTLVIRLEERLHLVSLVSLSRWKIASGTWTSWHEERSSWPRLPPSSSPSRA